MKLPQVVTTDEEFAKAKEIALKIISLLHKECPESAAIVYQASLLVVESLQPEYSSEIRKKIVEEFEKTTTVIDSVKR